MHKNSLELVYSNLLRYSCETISSLELFKKHNKRVFADRLTTIMTKIPSHVLMQTPAICMRLESSIASTAHLIKTCNPAHTSNRRATPSLVTDKCGKACHCAFRNHRLDEGVVADGSSAGWRALEIEGSGGSLHMVNTIDLLQDIGRIVHRRRSVVVIKLEMEAAAGQ